MSNVVKISDLPDDYQRAIDNVTGKTEYMALDAEIEKFGGMLDTFSELQDKYLLMSEHEQFGGKRHTLMVSMALEVHVKYMTVYRTRMRLLDKRDRCIWKP